MAGAMERCQQEGFPMSQPSLQEGDKWGVELETYEVDQERERQRAAENP